MSQAPEPPPFAPGDAFAVPYAFIDPRARQRAEFQQALWALTPRVPATPWLIIANVAVFLAMAATGVNAANTTVELLQAWGANYGPLTVNHQWWRLLTCTFVHVGFMHIFMNMIFLFLIGPTVERLLGRTGFLLTYLLSGAAASFSSLIAHPLVTSAGASVALFGLYGAILGFMILRRDSIGAAAVRRQFLYAAAFLGLNFVLGSSPGSPIDVAAHAGGLASGFILGMILSAPLTVAQGLAMRRRRDLVALVAGSAGLLIGAHFVPRLLPSQALLAELDQISASASRAVNRHVAGKLTQDELADVIQTCLGQWVEQSRRLDAIDPHQVLQQDGARELKQLARLTAYVGARGHQWTLLLDGLKRDDADLIQDAQDAGAYADRLRDYIDSASGSPI